MKVSNLNVSGKVAGGGFDYDKTYVVKFPVSDALQDAVFLEQPEDPRHLFMAPRDQADYSNMESRIEQFVEVS